MAAAVLTWRGEEASRACLRSLLGLLGPEMTAIVDNGSGTGEGARLAEEFGITEVTLAENGGVPAGYNAAIGWARDRGVSHVLLANNDLDFNDASLIRALADIADSDVAAVGPAVVTDNGSLWSTGVEIGRWSGHARRLTARANGPMAVDAIDGACMLVSVDAACRVGGLAPEFFLYWEETDWCTRARSAGYRILVEPRVSVVHHGRGSGSLRQTRRYALRNSLLYLRRNVRGAAGVTGAAAWLLVRMPVFVIRSLRERAGFRAVGADLRWALGWHLRDVAAHGWGRSATGPDPCT